MTLHIDGMFAHQDPTHGVPIKALVSGAFLSSDKSAGSAGSYLASKTLRKTGSPARWRRTMSTHRAEARSVSQHQVLSAGRVEGLRPGSCAYRRDVSTFSNRTYASPDGKKMDWMVQTARASGAFEAQSEKAGSPPIEGVSLPTTPRLSQLEARTSSAESYVVSTTVCSGLSAV
jgi:hypothetical protein